MTTPINDGGPAFPRPSGPPQLGVNTTARNGMSLRDWFAGQALAGWMARFGDTSNPEAKGCAVLAYQLADAMIAAREKGAK